MARLSVNLNKIATLRNARGQDVPNLISVAKDCERFGAFGITVHPRPDGRHVLYRDVEDLSQSLEVEFNVEGYPSKDFLELVRACKPDQVTLVPDPPDALTSTKGWDVVSHFDFLSEIVTDLKKRGMRTSIFLDPEIHQVEKSSQTGVDRIELHTGDYAHGYPDPEAIAPYIEAASMAQSMGLGVNAGHDLNLENLRFFIEEIPFVAEVSIGHALICESLYLGLENTIGLYLQKTQEV